MNEQDKELLLKDLYARLPYKVKVQIKANNCYDSINVLNIDDLKSFIENRPRDEDWYDVVTSIKPYFRPMSSMTEEEKEEFRSLPDNIKVEYGRGYGYCFLHCVRLGILPDNPHECIDDFLNMDAIDWLNANHFDYRGLIKKGLALEAPEGMYKI